MNRLLFRSDRQFAINAAADNNISDVRPIFDSLDWSEENYRMLERIGQTGKQWQICSAPAADLEVISNYMYTVLSQYTYVRIYTRIYNINIIYIYIYI